MKKKKCKQCLEIFTPTRQMQPTCSRYDCLKEYREKHLSSKKGFSKVQKPLKQKRFVKSAKSSIKEDAQYIVNKYAKLRDMKENGARCCTCNNPETRLEGGHYLPTSGYASIRYNTNQLHLQCHTCNAHGNGMRKEYRLFMIKKYGLEYVENLESKKDDIKRYSTAYLTRLIGIVGRKIERLKV